MATPCPVEGLVVEDDRPHDVTWLSWALGAKQPSERYRRTSLTVFASAPAPTSEGGPATEPLLVLPVRPVVVLDDAYKAVGERLGHDGSPFTGAVCNVSTMEPLTLAELHSGKDVVACIDTTKARPTDEAAFIPVPPGPPPRLIGKNADDLMPNLIVSHLKISKTYGPICRLSLPPSTDAVLISDPEMAEEILMSPQAWGKTHMKHQKMVRTFVGTGLFTSDDDEDIWHVAHRILLPAFSNQSMRGRYFDMVQQTVGELFEKWDALADGQQPVDLVTWAERFTLDIIGKVAFSQTFGAVTKGKHDYLDILQRQVDISQELQAMTYAHKLLHLSGTMKRWEACCSDQRVLVEDIVSTRKKELESGVDTQRTDLLTLMLTAKDPKTGQVLPDDNVTYQILTFLFAGHDTTSSAITMFFAMIAQHGDVEAKVLEEIERVVGSEDALTFEKLGKLEYCTAVINETLRMFPPAAAPRKTANEDTRLGPYLLPKGTAAFITTWGLAHNPDVWPDPWRFDPDRWLGEAAKTRNAFASVPFSYGPRACIGRQLSIMEQRSILVHAVRRYHIRLHSLSRPSITNPLLMKPHGFYLSLERRACTPSFSPGAPSSKADASAALPPPCLPTRAVSLPSGSRVVVLYGSNMGTCSELAERVAQSLGGKMRVDVCTLDSLLPQKDMVRDASAVVVICSSYNGTPPDNAVEFSDFVESGDKAAIESVFGGIPIAVFGAGNKQWSRTYQAVPTSIHAALVSAGAQPLLPLATGDADSDLDDAFETWRGQLVEKVYGVLGVNLVKEPSSATGEGPAYVLTPTRENPAATFAQVASDFSKRNGLFRGRVLENRELQAVEASGRSTRHIEVQLPNGLRYAAGDHLAVLAGNPPEVVERAARLLGEFPSSAYTVSLAVKEKVLSNIIPLNVPLTLGIMLMWCVELQLTATRAQISYLIAKCKCPPERAALEKLLTAYETEVHKPRRTVLELLEAHRSIKPTIAEFLTILPPLKPRFYSISSSPKSSATRVSVTVGVVKGVSPTGREHVGACSNFLARRMVGEPLRVFIKDTRTRFRLPDDASVPVIMVGPGTGVAPFRGFLQELEARKGANNNNGSALLFFGCRNEDCHLYKEEMEGFVQRGVLSGLYTAYSRPKGGNRGKGKVYVQQLIEDNAEQVGALLKSNAHIYVCGEARHMAPDVRRAFARVIAAGEHVSAQDGVMMVDLMVADGRYHEDVWAS